MSEEWDGGNEDVWLLWAIPIFLYLLGTAIWVYGWKTVLLVALFIVLVALSIVIIVTLSVLLVRLYLASETRRYRRARREIRRLKKWTLRRMRRLRR